MVHRAPENLDTNYCNGVFLSTGEPNWKTTIFEPGISAIQPAVTAACVVWLFETLILQVIFNSILITISIIITWRRTFFNLC